MCMVGDKGVGKTSLIDKYVLDHYDNRYFQTMGTRVHKKRVGARISEYRLNVVADLDIWDITGDKGLASLLRQAYFYGAHGVIGVCDASRRESLHALDYWMDSALQVVRGPKIGIAVNKADIPKKRILPREADITARAYNAHYLYVSARSGENVDALFAGLIIEILRKKLRRRRVSPKPTVR